MKEPWVPMAITIYLSSTLDLKVGPFTTGRRQTGRFSAHPGRLQFLQFELFWYQILTQITGWLFTDFLWKNKSHLWYRWWLVFYVVLEGDMQKSRSTLSSLHVTYFFSWFRRWSSRGYRPVSRPFFGTKIAGHFAGWNPNQLDLNGNRGSRPSDEIKQKKCSSQLTTSILNPVHQIWFI